MSTYKLAIIYINNAKLAAAGSQYLSSIATKVAKEFNLASPDDYPTLSLLDFDWRKNIASAKADATEAQRLISMANLEIATFRKTATEAETTVIEDLLQSVSSAAIVVENALQLIKDAIDIRFSYATITDTS
jgi:hypothetical protein